MFKAIMILITALPDILKLIDNMQKQNKETQTTAKVKDDVKSINAAFAARDAKALNNIFKS